MAPRAAGRCALPLLSLALLATAQEDQPPLSDPPERQRLAIDDEAMHADALELAKGPFLTLGLLSAPPPPPPQQPTRGGGTYGCVGPLYAISTRWLLPVLAAADSAASAGCCVSLALP